MNDWTKKYVDEADRKEKLILMRQRRDITTMLLVLSRRLKSRFGKYNKEAKYIEGTMIPYVERLAYLPPSYLGMIDGYRELIKFGKRVNRRIW